MDETKEIKEVTSYELFEIIRNLEEGTILDVTILGGTEYDQERENQR